MSQPTEAQLQRVLAAIKTHFAAHLEGLGELDQPKLYPAGFHCDAPSVAWEGMWEWTILASGGGIDDETYCAARDFGASMEDARKVATVKPLTIPGILLEPYSGWCMSIYLDPDSAVPAFVEPPAVDEIVCPEITFSADLRR